MKQFGSTNETHAGRSHEHARRMSSAEAAEAHRSDPCVLRTRPVGTRIRSAGKYPGGVWYGAGMVTNATHAQLVLGQQLLSRSARVEGQVTRPRAISRMVSR